MEDFDSEDEYGPTRSINYVETSNSTNAINFNMPLSLATNTSVNKSNIVTEYNDIHDPVSCLPVLQNIILPTMSKNMSTHEKKYIKNKKYLAENQTNIQIWAYDIANNHKYGKERMPLQRHWAVEDGIMRDSYSKSYFDITKNYEKQYNNGLINIYKFLDVINIALRAMKTECYYNYQCATFIEKKHWHYIENIWIMHQKLQKMYNNLLQQSKSILSARVA